jgi:hypothetical protein
MSMQIFTLATSATLPQARVLARSVERHQPDWPLDIVLVGAVEEPDRAAEADEPLHIRSAAEQLDLDVELLIARHEEEDLAALLLPRLLRVYAERGSGPVLHLPPTAWVLEIGRAHV